MGFYGNSYSYVAESFANVVLTNLINKNIELPTNFSTLPEGTQTLNLSAPRNNADLGITAGNYWIQLGANSDVNDPKFCVIHNKANNNSTTRINPFESIDLNEELGMQVEDLEYGQGFKIPQIGYDEAGHVFCSNEIKTYRLPPDKTGGLEARMASIDGDGLAEGEVSLKDTLLNRMAELDGKDESGNDILDSEGNNIDSLKTQLEGKVENAIINLSNATEEINTIKQTVTSASTNATSALASSDRAYAAANTALASTSTLIDKINDIIDYLNNTTSSVPGKIQVQ